jgi:hypothetical protein
MKPIVTSTVSFFRALTRHSQTSRVVRFGVSLLLIAASFLLSAAGVVANAGRQFNQFGNILITDQFNNRVIEIDPAGNIVWHYGNGPTDVSAKSIVGVNDAERIDIYTLMAGTGIPAGATPNCPNGCPDNRVIVVNARGNIVYQYGQFGVSGFGFNQLNTPVQATFLPNKEILITDQGNQRVIEVRTKAIVWQYGMNGVSGHGPNQLNNPNSAELLENGHVLIADEGNNRAIEVTRSKPPHIVATFSAQGTVNGMAFASRLPNGNTLLTDSNNSRIVEVDPTDTPVWQYFTNTRPGSNPNPQPTRAVRLRNGNTLISDQFNDQVIIVDPNGVVVASYGSIDNPGFSTKTSGVMNAPYSAYAIGDYTGLTPPIDNDGDADDH